jgi:DNA polymerase IV
MQPRPRSIIHVDLDAFFASVEELKDPSLKGLPLIVGGDPGKRGVVSSCSYAARQYGVRSAMPTATALRLCPQARLISPRHGEYSTYSDRVMAILSEYAPVVEQISIDEAFLDVTGCEPLYGSPETIARRIQERVRIEVGLPCSLGVASNKPVAKIATEAGKPNGLVVVPPGGEAEFLAPFRVEVIPGVGKKTADHLHHMGIRSVRELARVPLLRLREEFGAAGPGLYDLAHGRDDSPVVGEHEAKSISQERTFDQDTAEARQVRRCLLECAQGVGSELRRQALMARTLTLKLRFQGYVTITRGVTLSFATDVDDVIYQAALALLRREWTGRRKIRLVGIRASNLTRDLAYQLQLFEPGQDKQARVSRAIDEIRARFGRDAIKRASQLEDDAPVDDTTADGV